MRSTELVHTDTEKLALSNFFKAVDFLADHVTFPNQQINGLMKRVKINLERGDVEVIVNENMSSRDFDFQQQYRGSDPPLDVLLVPPHMADLYDSRLSSEEINQLLGNLVIGVSRWVERDKREEWHKSRREAFHQTVYKNPTPQQLTK
jgi:ssRNA-specific RNase YbeY (16S rRNA maturation enzyme)